MCFFCDVNMQPQTCRSLKRVVFVSSQQIQKAARVTLSGSRCFVCSFMTLIYFKAEHPINWLHVITISEKRLVRWQHKSDVQQTAFMTRCVAVQPLNNNQNGKLWVVTEQWCLRGHEVLCVGETHTEVQAVRESLWRAETLSLLPFLGKHLLITALCDKTLL